MTNLENATKKKRISEIDFIRGLCIILMNMDHLMLIILKFDYLIWGYDMPNKTTKVLYNISILFYDGRYALYRYYIRIVIISIFFIMSGISCSFSRNNKKRFIKISIIAFLINIITYVLSIYTRYYFLIEWGVFHCYAVCLLIYMIVYKLNKNLLLTSALIFSIVSIFIWVFEPSINGYNFLMPLGVPSDSYVYSVEYFPVLKWIPVFMFGAYIGNNIYIERKSKIQLLDCWIFEPLKLIGRNGILVYFTHYPIIIVFLYLIGRISL